MTNAEILHKTITPARPQPPNCAFKANHSLWTLKEQTVNWYHTSIIHKHSRHINNEYTIFFSIKLRLVNSKRLFSLLQSANRPTKLLDTKKDPLVVLE